MPYKLEAMVRCTSLPEFERVMIQDFFGCKSDPMALRYDMMAKTSRDMESSVCVATRRGDGGAIVIAGIDHRYTNVAYTSQAILKRGRLN
jgi:hypothetical protein